MGKARRARPLTLDAGALVAIERHDRTAGETDASVVVCARTQRGSLVLTSDPDDIRRLDPRLDLERV